jgi:hypothetical protein
MKVCLLLLMILVVSSTALAQDSDKIAAADIDKVLHHCSDLEPVIDRERNRLGTRFEAELLAYLGSDVDKHYWVACAVSGCAKQNDRALESMALLIQLQALSLLEGKKDDHSLYTVVALHVLTAVQSQYLGFLNLAIKHKSQAQSLVSRRPILKGGFPAMSEEAWKIYDSLPTQPVISPKRRAGSSERRSKN